MAGFSRAAAAMKPPPAARPSNAGIPAAPTFQVCLDGGLLRRVSREAAEELLSRGWAEWRGRGRRRYLELTEIAPLSSLFAMRGKYGTRVMRADGSLESGGGRAVGQVLGERRSHLEPIPPSI